METTTKDLKRELESRTHNYVNTEFNYIPLSVVERLYDGIHDYIRPLSINQLIEDYQHTDEYDEELKQYMDDNELEPINKRDESKEVWYDDFLEHLETTNEFDDYRYNTENYPMWGTLFEFRHEPSEEFIQNAIDSGFGIIEQTDDFNTMLFVSGCGYSFYGAHWIPLYLKNFDDESKYKDINYSNL